MVLKIGSIEYRSKAVVKLILTINCNYQMGIETILNVIDTKIMIKKILTPGLSIASRV